MNSYLLYCITYGWALVGITNSALEENIISYCGERKIVLRALGLFIQKKPCSSSWPCHSVHQEQI